MSKRQALSSVGRDAISDNKTACRTVLGGRNSMILKHVQTPRLPCILWQGSTGFISNNECSVDTVGKLKGDGLVLSHRCLNSGSASWCISFSFYFQFVPICISFFSFWKLYARISCPVFVFVFLTLKGVLGISCVSLRAL